MKYTINTAILSLLSMSLIYSCGQSSSGGGDFDLGTRQNEDIVDERDVGDANYKAVFETLNPHVNGTLPGSLSIEKKGERLLFYARLFAGKPKAWHPQGIYQGSRCPNLGDDTNGDGYIDIEEAMNVVGNLIIPLDANLNSQRAGANFYPLADLSGYYHYERSASLSSMLKDLKSEDKDPTDHIAKIREEDNFSFLNKVVLIQGVDEKTELPETVATLGRRKAFQMLPIACGVIRRFEGTVGTPHSGVDEAAWTVAEVIEGQDRPAPEGEYEIWEEETPSSGSGDGNTNDSTNGEVRNENGDREGRREPRPDREREPETPIPTPTPPTESETEEEEGT